MTNLQFNGSIKMLRETLCAAQGLINRSNYDVGAAEYRSATLQELIDECDRHRPLGVDGKHSNLHTGTCGCEDKGPAAMWGTVTTVFHAQAPSGAALCGGPRVFSWEQVNCLACLKVIAENVVVTEKLPKGLEK